MSATLFPLPGNRQPCLGDQAKARAFEPRDSHGHDRGIEAERQSCRGRRGGPLEVGRQAPFKLARFSARDESPTVCAVRAAGNRECCDGFRDGQEQAGLRGLNDGHKVSYDVELGR